MQHGRIGTGSQPPGKGGQLAFVFPTEAPPFLQEEISL